MIRLILVGLLLLLMLAFFLQNQEQEVTLHYLFGLRSASTPIAHSTPAAISISTDPKA